MANSTCNTRNQGTTRSMRKKARLRIKHHVTMTSLADRSPIGGFMVGSQSSRVYRPNSSEIYRRLLGSHYDRSLFFLSKIKFRWKNPLSLQVMTPSAVPSRRLIGQCCGRSGGSRNKRGNKQNSTPTVRRPDERAHDVPEAVADVSGGKPITAVQLFSRTKRKRWLSVDGKKKENENKSTAIDERTTKECEGGDPVLDGASRISLKRSQPRRLSLLKVARTQLDTGWISRWPSRRRYEDENPLDGVQHRTVSSI